MDYILHLRKVNIVISAFAQEHISEQVGQAIDLFWMFCDGSVPIPFIVGFFVRAIYLALVSIWT